MKRILIITNVFYPENNIAAIRLEDRIKTMVENQLEVYVVTQGKNISPNWGQMEVIRLYDNSLTESIYIDKKIDKHKNNYKLLDDLKKSKLAYPLKKVKRLKEILKTIKWSDKAFKEAKVLIKEKSIDIVYVTCPGIETLLAANKIKEQFPEVSVIAEFRDTMTGNKIYDKDIWIEKFEEYIERKSVKYVSKYVFLTELIKEQYCEKYDINDYVVITNGVRKINYNPENLNNKKIIITHTGNFYSSRNPINFIYALSNIIKNNKYSYLKNQIEVNFYGGMQDNLLEEVNRTIIKEDVQNIINLKGRIDSNKALEENFNSTINLMITHVKGSEYAIPGKFFEYLGARRPLMVISTDPLIKKFMEENYLGINSSHEIKDIELALENILDNINEFKTRLIDTKLAELHSERTKNLEFIKIIK